ncbi:ubiquinone biosynthesis O-methyltransferase, mitochondrial [Takifugu rubripes]|uniref:Ubiquinone biosynthesis O-methyltransferase, mitochondrial n=1 Tax=Takifugu rubripes TaxID=31033 RepID=H2RKA9_TAKRU|nr:ubiquinone biosynthesis O-methyltransferase, mitochondrial [Takifugu rubripes]|eukprot:XP_003965940.1 PREDICTED: hexaprenyldihydroxybenzoate methyltransferase, mitochondrial [Takifugu rubripes]
MFSCKFGRLISGLCIPKAAPMCGMSPTGFSWSAVCQRRTLRLQRTQKNPEPCHLSLRQSSHATVDPDEVRRFQLLSSKWWDEQGEFAALHAMNDLRVPLIRDNLLNMHPKNHPGRPLSGLKILDVGCGGGLLTEPLGRLGASVLGIDPVEDSISTAQVHASYDPELRGRLRYQACTLEELSAEAEEAGRFDALVASEVVEHLADLETFAFCCNHMLKPGGSLFITTINKTNLSYALGIVVAEQLLRIVPNGTHDWEKFISPVELERLLESNGFSVQTVQGMLYNPLSGAWSWTNSTAINYALRAVKVRDDVQPEPTDGTEEEESHRTGTHS